jgi:hypothetical protein
MSTINGNIAVQNDIRPPEPDIDPKTQALNPDLANTTATQQEPMSPAEMSRANFSPEEAAKWTNQGTLVAIQPKVTAQQTPAHQPNAVNSSQFVTPSKVSAAKSPYDFVGGILSSPDPTPGAARDHALAQNGVATATQYTDKSGDTIHIVRTPAPYYLDKDGNQQTLKLGQQAPKDAKYAYYDAYQKTTVRELKGNELGLLKNISGPNDPKLKPLLAKIEASNEAGISKATGGKFKTLEQARDFSRKEGYYGSGAHIAAANAASARVGGRIPAEWFMKQDPFMGRAGSNQEFAPTRTAGMYPGPTSKIGVAHDADYGLGANFKAGPLKDLYGRTDLKGYEGLDGGLLTETPGIMRETLLGKDANNPAPRYAQYGTGNKDWGVENLRGEETRINAGSFLGIGAPAPNPDLNWAIDQTGKVFNAIGEAASQIRD